jgi:plastocyanin
MPLALRIAMPVRKLALVLIAAAAVSACSGSPVSPSGVSPAANGAIGRAFDEEPAEGEPMPPAPAPAPAPGPEPGPAPGPAPEPAPAPAPAPPAPGAGALPVMISIVSSFGPGAYIPNPLTAVMGDTLIWINEDTRLHHLVMEDGTDLGQLAPGAQSAPVRLAQESTSYTCLLHSSMTGVINRQLPPELEPYPEYALPRRGQR